MAEEKAPTKEEIMKFLSEQIEVKELQLKLQELNTGLAAARAEELKALAFIGQMSQAAAKKEGIPDGVPHTITQEDLDNNPELVEAGVKVGDDVLLPTEDALKPEEASSKKLKKD